MKPLHIRKCPFATSRKDRGLGTGTYGDEDERLPLAQTRIGSAIRVCRVARMVTCDTLVSWAFGRTRRPRTFGEKADASARLLGRSCL
jgi:hypothetical protein